MTLQIALATVASLLIVFVLGFICGWFVRSRTVIPSPASRCNPSTFTFVSANILNTQSGECVLTVCDQTGREYDFRGSSTVWHHYPTGERAGRLWGLDAATVEGRLSDIWTAQVRWAGNGSGSTFESASEYRGQSGKALGA